MHRVKNKKDVDVIHGDYSITNVVRGTTEGALIHNKIVKDRKTQKCTSRKNHINSFNSAEFGTMLSDLVNCLSGLSGVSKVAKMKEFLDEKMSC